MLIGGSAMGNRSYQLGLMALLVGLVGLMAGAQQAQAHLITDLHSLHDGTTAHDDGDVVGHDGTTAHDDSDIISGHDGTTAHDDGDTITTTHFWSVPAAPHHTTVEAGPCDPATHGDLAHLVGHTCTTVVSGHD